jgi:hypothetical protein
MIFQDLKKATAFAVLALAAVIAGCDKKDAGETDGAVASDSSREGSSMVRLVNTVPSDGAVDVSADDAPAFTGIAFMTVTPYQSVKDNLVEFELRPSGAVPGDSTVPLAENREMLGDGDRYTIVVLPPADADDKPTLRVLEEPTDAGDAAKARIRFVNAAQGVETFDVFVPGQTDPFFDDVDFRTEAGFKDMNAGAAQIEVRGDDGGPVLLKLPEHTFEAGKTYTFILTRKAPTAKLEVVTIEDAVPATY